MLVLDRINIRKNNIKKKKQLCKIKIRNRKPIGSLSDFAKLY